MDEMVKLESVNGIQGMIKKKKKKWVTCIDKTVSSGYYSSVFATISQKLSFFDTKRGSNSPGLNLRPVIKIRGLQLNTGIKSRIAVCCGVRDPI